MGVVCVCVFGQALDRDISFDGGNERSEAKEFFKFKIKDTSVREEKITTRGKVPSPPRRFLAREISSSQRTKQAAIPLWPFLDTHFNEMSKMGDNCIKTVQKVVLIPLC